MSLRYAILGYLSTAPGTGYDLARQFDTGLGWFWTASHSQIYPELRRLTSEGLVERSVTAVTEHVDKYTYSLTPSGRAALRDWTAQLPSYPPNRDSERLQLIFCDETPKALRAHLIAHRDYYTERRTHLQETLDAINAGTHPRVNVRLADRSKSSAAITLKLRQLAYSGDIARATAEIEWAEAALVWAEQNLDELETAGVTAAPARRSRRT
jgi:PadR family transcriptional regulator, regulatory protein AphA